ncbi:MAG: hypothetical protein JW850_07120 [Thermoflexales bacterium]|nr:hypothetical protein [Thermoflexales bacterium]
MTSLLSPGIIMSALMATLCGAAFHVWRGGGYARLLLYLLAAWAGFALGQLAAWLSGWQFVVIGQVHLLAGIVGCLVLLVLTSWLKLA